MYNSEKRELRFNKNGKFRILMISDFHGRGNFNGVGRARFRQKMKDGIEVLLNECNPDFVMVGGDQCLGAGKGEQIDPEEDKKCIYKAQEDIMELIQKRGIPWTHVYGNYDAEGKLSKEEMQPVYESFPLCLSKRGPKDVFSVGN